MDGVPGVAAAPRPRGSWCLKERSPTGSPLEPSRFAGFPSSIPRLHEPDISTRILAELTARVRAHERARCTALAAQSCRQEGAPCPEPPLLLAGGAGAAVGPGCAAQMGMGFPGRICIFAVPAAGCLQLAPAGQCLCAPASRSRCLFALFNC